MDERVLVVEDEPSVRLLLVREIEHHGWTTAEAASTDEAIGAFADQSFDLVLTDIMMPGKNGIELLRWIKAQRPDTDVILITAFASLDSAAEGIRLGAADYLLKPFGSLDLVTASVRRVLERRRLATETDRLRQQLIHADRLVAIGQLAAGVVHEINNPATLVVGSTELLERALLRLRDLEVALRELVQRENPAVDRASLEKLLAEQDLGRVLDTVATALGDVRDGIHRIASIARDLRTFSRVDSRDVEQVALDDVARAALGMVAPQVRQRAELVVNLAQVPEIRANRARLAQVIVNLLVNAGHAIEEAGPGEHRISIATAADGGHVTCTVQDSGCGMTPEVKQRAFESFFTTKARDRGTGLGLSIAREIARGHGGDIFVESEPGRGSTFVLRLPLAG